MHEATEMMIEHVVPMVAEMLSVVQEDMHESLDLPIELHR